MAAILLRPNWPMVRGIFTGKVRLDYARHRHPLWLADIESVQEIPDVVFLETETPLVKEQEPTIEDTEEKDLPPALEKPKETEE
jgi:hypothetical protein